MRPVTAEEIQAYRNDGVVCLRGILDDEWIGAVRDAVDEAEQRFEEMKAGPGVLAGITDEILDRSHLRPFNVLATMLEEQGADILRDGPADGDGEFILVNNAVIDYEPVQRLTHSSPLGAIAGQLFGSDRVNFVFDQIFVKQPGAVTRTAFHQDQPYFCVDGTQVASMWTAAEPVDRNTGAMGYVKGSHLWDMHAPNVFVGQGKRGEHGLPQLPDIEGNEDDYDIVYFDADPGDVIVHDYRTVHGSRGNTTTDRSRRAVSLRFGGDDVTYLFRPSAPGEFPVDAAVGDGDPLGGDTFPLVWQRGS